MFEDGYYNYAWSKHVLHGKDREERLLGSKRRVFKVTKNNVGCTVWGWYSSLLGLSTFHNHLQFYINRLPIKVVQRFSFTCFQYINEAIQNWYADWPVPLLTLITKIHGWLMSGIGTWLWSLVTMANHRIRSCTGSTGRSPGGTRLK